MHINFNKGYFSNKNKLFYNNSFYTVICEYSFNNEDKILSSNSRLKTELQHITAFM